MYCSGLADLCLLKRLGLWAKKFDPLRKGHLEWPPACHKLEPIQLVRINNRSEMGIKRGKPLLEFTGGLEIQGSGNGQSQVDFGTRRERFRLSRSTGEREMNRKMMCLLGNLEVFFGAPDAGAYICYRSHESKQNDLDGAPLLEC